MASAFDQSGGFGSGANDKWRAAFFGDNAWAPLDRSVRAHLVRVYMTLGLGCAMFAAGSMLDMRFHFGFWLPLIGVLGGLYGLHSTSKKQIEQRLGWFSLVAVSQGMTAGSLIEVALHVDPTIVPMAAATSLILFASLSIAAYSAERRSMLYLGATLGSIIGWMSLASFVNIFMRSQILWNFQLYGGLLTFMGYVAFDTQLMLVKFEAGDDDFVGHATELFIDLAALFVRILIILLKNNEDKEERRRRNRR